MMNLPSADPYDVLIAGAGPVGLFLACELRLAGCSVQVLEKAPAPESPLKRAPFGLRGLSVATIEAFDRRGMLEALRAAIDVDAIATAGPRPSQKRKRAGHFAGIDIFEDQIDQAKWPYHSQNFSGPVAADLASIEAVLADRAGALGVVIRRGFAVTDIETTKHAVVVHDGRKTAAGCWLVGCDGARSAVRKAAGFGFAGTEPEFTGYFGEIELTRPEVLAPGYHETEFGTYIYDAGMIRMIEFDGGAFHRAGAVTRDHVQAVLDRISGSHVAIKRLGLATTWTDRAFLATDYRKGRVLLAGDAAHIHSPLGGQGLNLGIGDAMNLGWKLAAMIRRGADPDLLDSYEHERRPVAEQVLDWSRAQVAIMRPQRSAKALRSIVRDLIATRDGATYVAERIWGVSLSYNLGAEHPLIGRSAPDLVLSDGTRLNEHLRKGRALLIDCEGSTSLRTLGRRYEGQVQTLIADVKSQTGLSTLLLRPDGFVAWASTRLDSAKVAPLLAKWFGAVQEHAGE